MGTAQIKIFWVKEFRVSGSGVFGLAFQAIGYGVLSCANFRSMAL